PANDDILHVSIGAAIIAIWTGSPEFRSAAGDPTPLPYSNPTVPGFSFSALAESVSTDFRPRAILEEMIRQNIVRYNETTDQIWLNTEAYIPQKDWAKKLYYFGQNIEDHLNAAVTNILDEPVYLDRAVYYGELTEKSAQELQELARDETTKALRTVN